MYESFWSIINSFGTLVIAIVSAYLTYYVHKTEKKRYKKSVRLEWYKSIILDKKISSIFEFFENVTEVTLELKKADNNDQILRKIDDCISAELIKVRQDFVELIYAVDTTLYLRLTKEFDRMCDSITKVVVEGNMNLEDESNFDDYILNIISLHRRNIFGLLINFKG